MRLSFLLVFALCTGRLAAQIVPDKLEAYFSFDNCKAVDDSGNGASGQLLNDPLCVCGLQDSSIRLDGINDKIILVGEPINDVFTTSDFSICFYIKPRLGSGGTQLVMAKQLDCNAKQAFWVRYASNSRKISSGIRENDTLVATVTADLDADDCWQFITLTRSNQRYSLYVNGVLRNTSTSAARINLSSDAPLKIAEPVCTTLDKPFVGEIDELRIFSKALNTDEIMGLDLRPDEILNSDTLIYLGNSMQIRASRTCAESFAWSPADGVSQTDTLTPLITPTLPTAYVLQFSHSFANCIASDTLFVNVIDPDTLDCNQIFIPNAFTPGGTPNRNDVFGISNPFSVQEFISFEVFDRWGGRVFAAETAFDTWDGAIQGQPVNPGVFLYRLYYKCNGQEKVKAGSLTLIR